MKGLLALLVIAAAGNLVHGQTATPAFPFTYYLHDSTGQVADTPLPNIYQFAATPLGSNSHVLIKAVNTSGAPAFMGSAFVTASETSTTLNPNFTVTGLANSVIVAAGDSLVFTINFSPTTTGPITAYLQTSYQVQQGSCNFTSTSAATQCPGGLSLNATLTGSATQPQLVLTYQAASGSNVLQPSGTPLNFGNVSTSATSTITFTLANQSNVSLSVPSISVPAPTVYSSNPFALNTSAVPANLAGGASANFTITFAPGQTGFAQTNLIVGSNTYPIEGEGVVIADIDALQISYVDSTGVRTLPQAATPISFGQLVPGTATTNVLNFTVTNPNTSFNSVSIPAITVTGSAYTISAITGASSFPFSLAPGASLTFAITFTASGSGTFAGGLSIGSRSFSLTGLAVNPPLPSFSLVVAPSPLSSQEQATVAVQFSSASTVSMVGTIALSFSPSVSGISDDPAIMFMATSGRQLSITVAAGAQNAAYNGQTALAFQTGTTAGTITFTVNFPNTPTYTQSFTITPAQVQITSASAVTSDPNLVVTVAGYDNTYSAGQLSFTFYDTTGKMIAPIAVNATSDFQNLFFGSQNTAGGAFSLQATFPVTGNVTQVGSVLVSVSNSVGQATTTQNF